MPESAVKLSEVKVAYGKDVILDLAQLEFEGRKVHVLVGPNGSGKTTLLRVISGLQQPATGSVSVFGQDLYKLPRREHLRVMRMMTYCFQKPYMFNTSVRHNIEYGLRSSPLRHIDSSEKATLVESAVAMLNLKELQERNARTLSAGETQRVSLARALVLQPELVLLDEPLANVDAANRPLVEAAISGLHERGTTVVVATHEVGHAYRLSANVIRLERGCVAPPALENLLEGKIVEENGASVLVLGGGVSICVVTERLGAARAAIDPTSIIVSDERIDSSARNSFAGRIVALSELSQRVSLSVDIGIPLTAHITKESFANLGITLASEVFLTFKASAVTVF
jgi:tungstate transport system ATP-binding protein